MTLNMRQTIQRNQAIRVVESGLLGVGKPISVVSGDTLRFTRAIALGNGEFPEYDILKEEDINKEVNGYFIVEVHTPEPIKELVISRLITKAVVAGFYYQACCAVKETDLGLEDFVWRFKTDSVISLSKDFSDKDTLIEVEGILTESGNLMFIKTSTYQEMYSEHEEITVVCDGFVYPYDTQVTINDDMSVSLSDTPIREMKEDEWALAKTQPADVKFIHQAM